MMINTGIKSRYTNTKSGYVKLYLESGKVVEEHRYVIANALGRDLDVDEVVHHKDGNKQNNDISNLELISRSSHAYNHNIGTAAVINLTCANCGNPFTREARQYNSKARNGQKDFYCSRSCCSTQFGRGRSKNTAR